MHSTEKNQPLLSLQDSITFKIRVKFILLWPDQCEATFAWKMFRSSSRICKRKQAFSLSFASPWKSRVIHDLNAEFPSLSIFGLENLSFYWKNKCWPWRSSKSHNYMCRLETINRNHFLHIQTLEQMYGWVEPPGRIHFVIQYFPLAVQ